MNCGQRLYIYGNTKYRLNLKNAEQVEISTETQLSILRKHVGSPKIVLTYTSIPIPDMHPGPGR